MAAIEANGITIEYEIEGEGEPLLLVMGLGGQLTSWPAEFVTTLAQRGFQVIRYDNRDSGLSTTFSRTPAPTWKTALKGLLRRKPESEYLIEDMAADGAGLLRALGIDAAHVVGMSMGGMIAQTMAFTYPEMVLSLCSVMSNTGDGKGGIDPKLALKLRKATANPSRETAVEMSVETFRAISGDEFDEAEHRAGAIVDLERSYLPEGTARQTEAIMASPARNEMLKTVVAPTLVIHGLSDPLVTPKGGLVTATCVRNSRLLMFPGMGHTLPRSRWVEILDAIEANTRRATVDLTEPAQAVSAV